MQIEKTPDIAPPAAAEKLPVLVVDDEFGPRGVHFVHAFRGVCRRYGRARQGGAREDQGQGIRGRGDGHPHAGNGRITAVGELRKIDPHVSVIMLTGYGTLLTAQQSMVAGANQYLRKPPDIAELVDAVRKQTQATRVRRIEAKATNEALSMNAALKKEMQQHEPQVWQGRASVELVHDLNNPLTVVIGYAALVGEEANALAQHDPALAKKLIEYARVVEKAAEYCRHLSENWRAASKQLTQFDRVDLVAIAQEVRAVIFFGNPAIEFAGLGEAWIRGSKFELMRVFQNLFKNSLEAGTTRLLVTPVRRGEQIELILADNGAGMDADRVKRAMHGGFTSKASGTGLGLSICRHLAGTHGATFALESEPGKGTTVRLVFPAAPQG